MVSTVRVDILGELEVRTEDGTAVAVPGSRLRALVALLALAGGRPVPSERLIEELWDEDERPAGAANALQVLVSRLRRALPEGLVESRPRAYRLALEPEALDSWRFERLVAHGRTLAGSDDAEAAAAFRSALALWRGPALADLDDAGSVRLHRDRLEELRLAVTEDRVEAELALGAGSGLVPELEMLVAAHPLRERPRAQLMRALFSAGRRADALAAYEDVRRRLSNELGVDPGPELAAAHLAVLRGEGGAPPPRPARNTAPRRRTNVRAQLTHFVGREEEVAQVERLLEDSRLLTLVGPGGAGKTRLASECASRLVDAMPDGVWMVELASVTDSSDVPRALVSVLGLRADGLIAQPASTPGPQERLEQALRDKRLLLVMDNCEQVVASAAALVDRLLAHCPQLRVLATSREPLGITGEQLIQVDPLPVPEAVTPAELAVRSPVVRLFSERAAAARPSFRVTHENVAVVLDICRALDGLPLAIELAATRLRSMSPEQVRSRLDDRFALLTAGSRTALPRQQTLHAVVDWSWELLSVGERELAMRFCVFRSGAFLDAVERVTACTPGSGDGAPRQEEVLGLLHGLVGKSFLTINDRDGEPRFHMLETVRAFALAKLDASGLGEDPRHQHARYFLALAERAEPQLRRHDQLTWLRRLTLEHDEFTAALNWAAEQGESEIATRLVAALGWYWFLRGFRQEAAEWAERALALDPAPVPPAARALALVTALPQLVGEGSDPVGFRARMAEVRELIDGMERDGDPFSHPALGLFEPIANMLSGDGFLLESVRRRSRDADPWVRGLAHLHRGQIETTLGETQRGAADYDLAAQLFRGIGERWGTAQVLVAGAEAHSSRGERRAAIDALEEALRLIGELGDREDQPLLMVRLATERAYDGDLERAQEELGAALELADELGAGEQRVLAQQAMGDVARWAGATGRARQWLERALGDFEATGQGIDQVHTLLLASLGSVEVADGRTGPARERFAKAVGQLPPTPEPGIVARLLELLADVELADGRPLRAARLLGAADTLRGTPESAASGPDSARVTAGVRAALPREDYLASYRRGAGTGHRAAVALLRAEAGERPAP
ncbi:AAA family ATPase [Streptomyces sp. NBC_00249]|uniref:BTAD domain-containing putative transcriptional regulator n=1 Tax=Streptomyces sp. NBC_00249 TaxID=2975690 RepID=UPI00225A9F9A|nr:BTAD domain-containing putative transcriptional regulator [Streptomyces sp. NBC_00249]MCX5199476.1 AAA family ATPase [Streptomyces sp. NBC_00249]